MPSPKAVLRDIADLGVDPKVAHRHFVKGGRLKASERVAPPEHVAGTEETLKLALKRLEKKAAEAVKEEPVAVEEKAPEEPKKVEAAVEAPAEAAPVAKPVKKEKPAKAVATPVPASEPEADDAKKA